MFEIRPGRRFSVLSLVNSTAAAHPNQQLHDLLLTHTLVIDGYATAPGLVSKSGKFYFTLKAPNHQIIGNSEMYESEAARDHGIAVLLELSAGRMPDC